MKLYLDDVRECPKGWVPVRNALDAIQLLEEQSVEEMSFDHDLGDGLTGYDVLNWIEKRVFEDNEYNPPKIWTHTGNPAGRRNMLAVKKQIEKMVKERPAQEIVDLMHLNGVEIQEVKDLKGICRG